MDEQTQPQPQPPSGPLSKEDLFNAILHVEDPELHIGIVDLGLVYDAKWEDDRAMVEMTLTSPGCPYGPRLLAQVHQSLAKLPQVKEVKIDLVWSPPWDPRTMATEEGKVALGIL